MHAVYSDDGAFRDRGTDTLISQMRACMKLYLNRYQPIIRNASDEVYFPYLDKAFYPREQIDDLRREEGIDEEELVRSYGKEQIDKWKKAQILLPFPIQSCGRYSRESSFEYFLHMDGCRNKLERARVLILGCGGIGSHVAWNMAALGIGHVFLVDSDVVEESNLNRQLLYDTGDIGKSKEEVLGNKLKKINPNTKIYPIHQRVDCKEALEDLLVNTRPDVVVKSFDSPIYISRWLDEACEKLNCPYVCGIMNGTRQLLGPTYLGRGTARFSDFFYIDPDMEKVGGIAPSLSFELMEMAAGLSEEVFKLLTGYGNLNYKNRIIESENISNIKNVITTDLYDAKSARGRGDVFHNLLILVFIYWIGSIFLHTGGAALALTILYALIASALISEEERSALLCANVFSIFCIGMNYFNQAVARHEPMNHPGDLLVQFTTVITVVSVLLLLFTALEMLVWNGKKRIIRYMRGKGNGE